MPAVSAMAIAPQKVTRIAQHRIRGNNNLFRFAHHEQMSGN
jgi:hypothetical protein